MDNNDSLFVVVVVAMVVVLLMLLLKSCCRRYRFPLPLLSRCRCPCEMEDNFDDTVDNIQPCKKEEDEASRTGLPHTHVVHDTKEEVVGMVVFLIGNLLHFVVFVGGAAAAAAAIDP